MNWWAILIVVGIPIACLLALYFIEIAVVMIGIVYGASIKSEPIFGVATILSVIAGSVTFASREYAFSLGFWITFGLLIWAAIDFERMETARKIKHGKRLDVYYED